MIGSTRQGSVFAFGAPTDMRKSYDTLAALVTHTLGRDVLSGDVFVFVGKRAGQLSARPHDGAGRGLT